MSQNKEKPPGGRTAEPCGPDAGAPAGKTVTSFSSSSLSAIVRDVQSALETARRASTGLRKWASDSDGMAGAVLDTRRYRLGSAACEEELESTVAEAFSPSANDSTVKMEVRPTASDPAAIDSALNVWVRSSPEEKSVVADLAQRLAAVSGGPDLRMFVVKGTGTTTRSGGVAIVDPGTREALLVFGRAVRMTVDKRVPRR